MKRVSLTEFKFKNCIIKSVTVIDLHNGFFTVITHYFDRDDEINLIVKSKMNREELNKFSKAVGTNVERISVTS